MLYIKDDLTQMACLPLFGKRPAPDDQDLDEINGVRVSWPNNGLLWDHRSEKPLSFEIPEATKDPLPMTLRFLREGPCLLRMRDDTVIIKQCGAEREFTVRLPKEKREGIWLQRTQSDDKTPVISLFREEYEGKSAYANVDVLRVFEWNYQRKELRETALELRKSFHRDGDYLRPIKEIRVADK